MQNCFKATASTRDTVLLLVKELIDAVESETKGLEKIGGDDDLSIELSASTAEPTEPSIKKCGKVLRKLFPEEEDMLKTDCRCSCTNDDWSKFYVVPPKKNNAGTSYDMDRSFSAEFKSLVSNNHFNGFIIFDMSSPLPEAETALYEETVSNGKAMNAWSIVRPGLHSNLCVSDSIISIKTCRIHRNSLLSRTFLAPNSVVINCGRITSSIDGIRKDCVGKINISVGAESGGGRSLNVAAESTMIDICKQLLPCGSPDTDTLQSSCSSVAFSVVLPGSIIRDTPTVEDVFLYPFASIEAACSVKNSTLFSYAGITNSSTVSNTLMQFHSSISDNSKINDVLLMEHSHCGPSSIVESSIIGPDSHTSAGEIHASIFGPNTNSHHQSVLIGVIWPLGRGNVGYGANVGSNHTGRLPDQECTAGEGIFWGLSCIVKFPVDLTMAPYSMIAAGTKIPPQRITFPFSLILESLSDHVNEIIPGWVLHHSPYTLARNEKKFATRRKAKVHAYYTGWKIIRPATVERCRVGRDVLKSLMLGDRNFISSDECIGTGKCRLTKRAIDCGIKAYTNCIGRYALEGFLDWFEQNVGNDYQGRTLSSISNIIHKEFATVSSDFNNDDGSEVRWPSFPWDFREESASVYQTNWPYQRKLLVTEFPCIGGEKTYDVAWMKNLFQKLVDLENDFAERVASSKQRDDSRGTAVIPGYAENHVAAENDPVVVEMRETAISTRRRVQDLLSQLPMDE